MKFMKENLENKTQKSNQNSTVKTKEMLMSILYTNADQLTTSKKSELLETVERTKPHIIAINEVKPKNGNERSK